jgi:multidrug resistance efflux pump
MDGTKKRRRGKAVVISILLLAILGAGLTWQRYSVQAPSTKNARLMSDGVVVASFDARAARNIREGNRAIVTFSNSPWKKLSGTVQSLQIRDPDTTAVIILKELPQEAQPQTPCDVTVDTSVASEALNPD